MTRNGKIARLPKDVREQLNRRLEDGDQGKQLVEWLNGLAEVKAVLAAEFSGQPINEQNLTTWRQGGYRDWVFRHDTLARACGLSNLASEVEDTVGDSLADELATVLVARYAALLAGWDGEPSEEFHRSLRALSAFSQEVVPLRRGAHSAARLRVEQERWTAEQQAREGEKQAAKQLGPLQGLLLATVLGDLYERKAKETGKVPAEVIAFLSAVTPEQAEAAGVSAEKLQHLLQIGIKLNQGESSPIKPGESACA